MELDEKLLQSVDLNSLLVLLVVYREQSVSKAAACLGVGQPAVSNTLAKLRVIFGDPLFTSYSRPLHPTEASKTISLELAPALLRIQTVLQASHCGASSSR